MEKDFFADTELLAAIGKTTFLTFTCEKVFEAFLVAELPDVDVTAAEMYRMADEPTLGALFSEFQTRAQLNPMFAKQITDFIAARNRFVHHIDELDGFMQLHTEDGRKAFIAECEALSRQAASLQFFLLTMARGIPPSPEWTPQTVEMMKQSLPLMFFAPYAPGEILKKKRERRKSGGKKKPATPAVDQKPSED